MTYRDVDWPVRETSTGLTPLRWITGRVLPGDVHTLFVHLCERFNDEVEPIAPTESWGWANRNIRGDDSPSRHARAIAIDLNAPDHSLGYRNTFTREQTEAIRDILADLGGVIRWGGDYENRADEMHFEINDSPAAVRAAVLQLEEHMAFTDEDRALLKATLAEVTALRKEQKKRAELDALRWQREVADDAARD